MVDDSSSKYCYNGGCTTSCSYGRVTGHCLAFVDFVKTGAFSTKADNSIEEMDLLARFVDRQGTKPTGQLVQGREGVSQEYNERREERPLERC